MSKLSKTVRICFDLLILSLLALIVYMMEKWLEPFKRGFFCNDESLEYPFREETISKMVLLVIIVPIPCLFIIKFELFFKQLPANKLLNHVYSSADRRKHHHYHQQHQHKVSNMAHTQNIITKNNYRFGYRLTQCYHQLIYYMFGLGLTLIATEIAKNAVGHLRPHFIAVCQPQMPDGSTCLDPMNHGVYLDDYICTNANYSEYRFKDIKLSFPSGHASTATYAMVYLALYTQIVITTSISKLFKHLLQFSFIMIAWFICLTRISDYHHHWSDVISGILIGTFFAYILVRFIAELLPKQTNVQQQQQQHQHQQQQQQQHMEITNYPNQMDSIYGGQIKPVATAMSISSGGGGGGGSSSGGGGGGGVRKSTANGVTAGAAAATATGGPGGGTPTTVLPAYACGTIPYLHIAPATTHHQHYAAAANAAQTFHNYGYVP